MADLTDDPVLPVVYSGIPTEQLPNGWFPEFTSNTYRVVATPLQETFDRRVLNQLAVPSAEDPVLDEASVLALLRSNGGEDAYLVQVLRPDALSIGQRVGTVSLRIPVLDRQPDPADEKWRIFDLVLEVRRVSA